MPVPVSITLNELARFGAGIRGEANRYRRVHVEERNFTES